MIIEENISLQTYNTFKLEYKAATIIHLHTEPRAQDLFRRQRSFREPVLIIGGGSNLLFISDFRGTLLQPQFGGITIESRDGDRVLISAGAGINWDNLVEWTVENGLGGLENLSIIPGSVGASPVQNIGAYGVEVRETIDRVEALDITNGSKRTFTNEECGFAYRYSIFKGPEKGKYMVTRVFFRLSSKPVLRLDYGSLKDEVKRLGIRPAPGVVRQAVINIRRSKLPDPAYIGNAGSFFKNPVVPATFAKRMRRSFPGMPVFRDSFGAVKLPAGWLIEQCGWKGKRLGNAGVYDKQALIIINHGNATGEEILEISEQIRASVREKFGIDLEREVEVVGAT